MQTLSHSADVVQSSHVHLGVLDEFVFVVQRKMAETTNGFVRDSLSDLLADLMEQRDDCLAVITPVAVAA